MDDEMIPSPATARRSDPGLPGGAALLAGAALLVLPAAPGLAPASGQMEPPALDVEENELLGEDLIRVEDRPEEGALEVIVGPVSLEAGGPHLRTRVQLVELPIRGWLHGFTWEIRDAGGRPLPDDLLHHVNLIDPDARELFAPIPRRVVAAGRETKTQELPGLLGYPLEEGTRVLVSAMFANPTPRDVREAYLHVRLFYSEDGDHLIDPRTVYPFYLDVMGPVGPKEFDVPPGRTAVSWEGSPAIPGRILGIGGHVHDHADTLRLVDVTEGEVLWETAPSVDEEGRVTGVPASKLWWRGGVKVEPDHTYRIEVVYRNPLDRPAPDRGMGAIGGILLASGAAEWPALDRTDHAYAADLRNTLEEPFRSGGHGHGEHTHEAPGAEGGAAAAAGPEAGGANASGPEAVGAETDGPRTSERRSAAGSEPGG